MTNEEIAEWEHRPNVINVLTSQEMGAWLHRRDERIKELEQRTGHWIMPVQDDGMSDPIYYQVRCSKCGFDLDPQTWHMELHQYGADKFCPKCGAKMESEDKE